MPKTALSIHHANTEVEKFSTGIFKDLQFSITLLHSH